MKTTTLKSLVSLLFAMLISVPGMSQDNDVPAAAESGVLVLPGTEADMTDAKDELKAEVGDEQWLDAALLRYRNLKQRTDGLETEWLKQFEATLARVVSRTNAAGKSSSRPATLVSSTEQTALLPLDDERLELDSAAATQSITPLLASTVTPPTESSLDSETLKRLCQLENRVSQLERQLAVNGMSVNVGNSQTKEMQQ